MSDPTPSEATSSERFEDWYVPWLNKHFDKMNKIHANAYWACTEGWKNGFKAGLAQRDAEIAELKECICQQANIHETQVASLEVTDKAALLVEVSTLRERLEKAEKVIEVARLQYNSDCEYSEQGGSPRLGKALEAYDSSSKAILDAATTKDSEEKE